MKINDWVYLPFPPSPPSARVSSLPPQSLCCPLTSEAVPCQQCGRKTAPATHVIRKRVLKFWKPVKSGVPWLILCWFSLIKPTFLTSSNAHLQHPLNDGPSPRDFRISALKQSPIPGAACFHQNPDPVSHSCTHAWRLTLFSHPHWVGWLPHDSGRHAKLSSPGPQPPAPTPKHPALLTMVHNKCPFLCTLLPSVLNQGDRFSCKTTFQNPSWTPSCM